MHGSRWMAAIVLIGSLVGLANGQERKNNTSGSGVKNEPPAKIRGTLPQNYGKLNLSDDQKQQIYRLKAKFAEKIEALEKQIEQAKAERNEAYRSVLTKAQKERLNEILRGPLPDAKEKDGEANGKK